MAYLRRRKAEAKAKELYKQIREEHVRHILETGKHWMMIVENIPMARLTTEEVRWVIIHAKKDMPHRLKVVTFRNYLKGIDYTPEGFEREYGLL